MLTLTQNIVGGWTHAPDRRVSPLSIGPRRRTARLGTADAKANLVRTQTESLLLHLLLPSLVPFISACGDDDEQPAPFPLVVSSNANPGPDVVRLDEVNLEQPGIVAIVQEVDLLPTDPPIGLRALPRGRTADIDVALERKVLDGERLFARLHVDANQNGAYDWIRGGAHDPILLIDGQPVVLGFTVTSSLALEPSILVDNQTLAATDPTIVLKSVVTSSPGFAVIRPEVSTSTTPLGLALVQSGLTPLLEVELSPQASPPAEGDRIEAALYIDTDEDGSFDPAQDAPALVDGEPVKGAFDIQSSPPR